MSTDLNALITATDKEAQYDECAKQLLGHKIILAHILKYTIDEFKGMDPEEITYYIEGDPYISRIPVDPGYTNTTTTSDSGRITGFNTENQELNEGLIKCQSESSRRFRAWLRVSLLTSSSAQPWHPPEAQSLTRA